MKRAGRLLALLVLLCMATAVVSCIAEDDKEKKSVPLTWDRLARLIDEQFGDVSDGQCSGDVVAVAPPGVHCKNQLKGKSNKDVVKDYVRIMNDDVVFGDTIFYERGFQIKNDLCLTDGPGGNYDYGDFSSDWCAPFGGTLTCEEKDVNTYKLTYNNCQWADAGITWLLDGKIDVKAYVTEDNEQIAIMDFDNFYGADMTSGGTPFYYVDGQVTAYRVLDPFSGTPAFGTTGGADGMVLFNASFLVDTDGAANPSPQSAYRLYLGEDYEDGLFFMTGATQAVWVSETSPIPAQLTGTRLFMYDKTYQWNYTQGTCFVDLDNLDPVTRTVDVTGTGSCMTDLLGLPLTY